MIFAMRHELLPTALHISNTRLGWDCFNRFSKNNRVGSEATGILWERARCAYDSGFIGRNEEIEEML